MQRKFVSNSGIYSGLVTILTKLVSFYKQIFSTSRHIFTFFYLHIGNTLGIKSLYCSCDSQSEEERRYVIKKYKTKFLLFSNFTAFLLLLTPFVENHHIRGHSFKKLKCVNFLQTTTFDLIKCRDIVLPPRVKDAVHSSKKEMSVFHFEMLDRNDDFADLTRHQCCTSIVLLSIKDDLENF